MLRVNVQLPRDLYEKVVAEAEIQERSVAGMVRWLVMQSIEEDERSARRAPLGFGVPDGRS